MIKTHELKILPKYYKDVLSGIKTFELRKNDRGFNIGDYIILKEFSDGAYTGRSIRTSITYILHGGEYGLSDGYVILGIDSNLEIMDT